MHRGPRLGTLPPTSGGPEMSRCLILMRHGETPWNSEARFTTRSDIPLSEEGVVQAEEAAAALAPVRIDRIYSSPMQRAHATARIVASRQASPCGIRTDPRLVEIDAGPFEGMTEQEILAGPLAAAFEQWHRDEGDPVFPEGAEPFDAARERAQRFLDEHAGESGTTLVVTHGSLARLIVSSCFLDADPARHRRLWLDNCRLGVFEWREDRPKLVAFNVRRLE